MFELNPVSADLHEMNQLSGFVIEIALFTIVAPDGYDTMVGDQMDSSSYDYDTRISIWMIHNVHVPTLRTTPIDIYVVC